MTSGRGNGADLFSEEKISKGGDKSRKSEEKKMFGVQSLPCSNAVRELEFSSLQFMCCEQAFRMRSVIVIFKGEVSGEQKCPGGQMDVR